MKVQVNMKDLYETDDTGFLIYVRSVCERVQDAREAAANASK